MYFCTNLKLTVWHNLLNWVHSAWSYKTYRQFVTNYGANTGVIYIRSFPNFFRPTSSSSRANGANIALSPWFWYLAYIVWLFDPLFSLVCFSGLYIYIYIYVVVNFLSQVICKMRHNAWQSETNSWVCQEQQWRYLQSTSFLFRLIKLLSRFVIQANDAEKNNWYVGLNS